MWPKTPSFRDPRYVQVSILLTYALVAREFFHFERTHWTTAACIGTSIALDLMWGRLLFGRLNFPLSAMIIGCASSLLMDSRTPWIYGAAAIIATTSKALITYKGKHVFNPANFGVACMLLLLPEQAASMPHLFAGHIMPSIVFFSLGLFTVLWAGQTEISLSWLVGFVVFAFIRAGILNVPWERTVTPILGPGLLLFTFHMISDPGTTPRTRPWRLFFGVTVALIDALLRYKEIPGSPLFALLITAAIMPLIRDLENRSASKAPPERVNNPFRIAS
jgi:Na+-translocating ferredoxin:NAD+ oxidoreductase RnfD subunit